MADIFDEINAELRQDRLGAVWGKYGIYVIGVALVIILVVAGSSGWQALVSNKNEQASAAYETLLSEIEAANIDEQVLALAKFSANKNNAYQILADLRRAKLLNEEEREDEAVVIYDALAANRSLPVAMRDYAQLASVSLLVDTAKPAELEKRLKNILDAQNPFRHMAREILALSYFQEKDYLRSKELLNMALGDSNLPAQLRLRLEVLNKNVNAYLQQGAK